MRSILGSRPSGLRQEVIDEWLLEAWLWELWGEGAVNLTRCVETAGTAISHWVVWKQPGRLFHVGTPPLCGNCPSRIRSNLT